MALPVCQFVDRVGSGAVQRLNLNDGKYLSLMQGPEARPGPDFSPPPLKRAVVNTLMVEGASIPASAYDNRIIRLPLRVKACSEEEMAEILETLHRELDRSNNILKWQPTYNHPPVYFRTFRSPDYRLDQTMEGRAELKVTLAIVAEPFGYGDYVEQTGIIYEDPEAVANGLFFEIAGAEGDVPTPLWLFADNLLAPALRGEVLAVRRHGTPALYFEQAEAMVQGVDTALQPNDPLMSGAGQNHSRTTFAAPAMAVRLTWAAAPGAGSSVDYRGTYRVFARIRRQNNVDDINLRVGFHPAGITGNPPVATIKDAVLIQIVDLGLVAFPFGADPVYDGYTGIIMPAPNSPLYFSAEREAGGTGWLEWDYVVLAPADEEFAIGDPWAAFDNLVFDGPNDLVFHFDGAVIVPGQPTLVGSIPLVTPDQTNRYIILEIYPSSIATAIDYTARYWPRYLYIR